MEELNIEGVDRAALLAGLYNNTRSAGMGRLHDIGREMTVEEAREIVERVQKQLSDPFFRGELNFDWVAGRPIKVIFAGDRLQRRDLYDRDAGDGVCVRVLEAVRAGRTGRLSEASDD